MPIHDSPESNAVLAAFGVAWNSSLRDYQERRLNSERCLQASLYYFLRMHLSESYKIYIEAVVRYGEASGTKQRPKVQIDTLVCYKDEIIAAIELKYAPRGEPDVEKVKKDVLSLSRISNPKRLDERVSIELPRYRNSEGTPLKLRISPYRKLIFASYCQVETERLTNNKFWENYKPEIGYWCGALRNPPNIGIAIAYTREKGAIESKYFGPAFRRQGTLGVVLPESAAGDA